MNMKKFAAALLIILCFASMAAAFGKKGVIPEGDPISYRGLRVSENGVSLTLVNKGDKAVTFNAALVFLSDKRKELGDTYIEKTTIEPGGEAVFKDLFLKGDYKVCRKAATIAWTIYLLEAK
ncbi:MAG: hypothetical protein RRY12_05485 [Cloacibacillus sp.]